MSAKECFDAMVRAAILGDPVRVFFDGTDVRVEVIPARNFYADVEHDLGREVPNSGAKSTGSEPHSPDNDRDANKADA